MERTRAAFLFDLDGTLADTLGDIAATTNHVRVRYGLAPLTREEVRSMIGDGARVLLRRALAHGPGGDLPPGIDLEEAVRAYREHHLDQCTRTAALYPGVRTHLERLHEAGHPLAVVTNKPEEYARLVVRHLGLTGMFPVLVGGDSLAQRKPHPLPVLHALEALGTVAATATMVGDSENDVRSGRAAGTRTIAVLYGYGSEAVLRAAGADDHWRAFGVSC